jgi:hypothetical protein
MGEILGIGLSHYPGLVAKDENMNFALKQTLDDPGLPELARNPENWPTAMREEWANDRGTAAAGRHREILVDEFRKARDAIDAFDPDFVLIWGDDQYENFQEDIIPAFSVFAFENHEVRPWQHQALGVNAWDEPEDIVFNYDGHQKGGKYLVSNLIEQGFDIAYSYKPLHHDMGHAFINIALFLDYDRKGFNHPILPFQVNCYGRRVIWQKAGIPDLTMVAREEDLDPPSPMPWRCFDLGAATARAIADSPWKVALVASGSWSHAFLTEKNDFIRPDLEHDRELFDALRRGDWERWRNTPLSEIEESGDQEVLNWMCLAGAMSQLGRKPDHTNFIETNIFNSPKAFAIFNP